MATRLLSCRWSQLLQAVRLWPALLSDFACFHFLQTLPLLKPFTLTMWYVILVLFTGTEGGHMSFNTSDVITTYMGHADAVPVQPFRTGTEVQSGTENVRKVARTRERVGERKGDKLKERDRYTSVKEEKGEQDVEGVDSDYLEQTTAPTEANNDIVFIPSGNNDAQSFSRRVGSGRNDEYSVKDMMERVAIGDIINERPRVETEAPIDGVVFKPGKNNEQTEDKIKHELDDQRIEQAVKEYKEIYENPIDCENLDCENVVESVCGVKLLNKRPKYRLFMNECYFRKVNCGLKYEYNRYRTVPLKECDGVGSHTRPQEQPGWIQYHPRPPPSKGVPGQTSGRRSEPRRAVEACQIFLPTLLWQILMLVTLRAYSGDLKVRAMTSNTNGLPCEHFCPTRCPDEYAPVCAHAYPKRTRVFQNHCRLDLQSCNDGSVWQERPLAECAGEVRAEVHERAAFIGWMQRMGILDKKGHLVM